MKTKIPASADATCIEKTADKPVRQKKIIKICVGIFLIMFVCVIITFFWQMNTKSISVNTYFPSVYSGKNPDGSSFDMQEILCDEVLKDASEKIGGRVDVSTLKKHLSVSSVTTSDDNQNQYQSIKEGKTDYTSFPSNYLLTYSSIPESVKNKGFFASCEVFFKQLSYPSKEEILSAVVESYKKYYENKYFVKGDVMAAEWNEVDSLDYYNKYISVKNYTDKIYRFVSERYDSNVSFDSKTSENGYGEILNRTKSVMDVDIENYRSLIIQNGLSNNKTALMQQFRYMQAKSEDSFLRYNSRYAILKDAIAFYDADVTKVVFIPSLDREDSFYMNRTKVGMDYLVELADSAKLSADDAQHSVSNYDYLISNFENAPAPGEDIASQADEIYENLKIKIDAIVDDTLLILDEESRNDKHMKVESGEAESGFNLIGLAIGSVRRFVILFAACYFVFSLFSVLRKKRRAIK